MPAAIRHSFSNCAQPTFGANLLRSRACSPSAHSNARGLSRRPRTRITRDGCSDGRESRGGARPRARESTRARLRERASRLRRERATRRRVARRVSTRPPRARPRGGRAAGRRPVCDGAHGRRSAPPALPPARASPRATATASARCAPSPPRRTPSRSSSSSPAPRAPQAPRAPRAPQAPGPATRAAGEPRRRSRPRRPSACPWGSPGCRRRRRLIRDRGWHPIGRSQTDFGPISIHPTRSRRYKQCKNRETLREVILSHPALRPRALRPTHIVK